MSAGRRERLRPWLVPAAFAGVRVAFRPSTYNGHAIMYPIVAELGGSNQLELFHPLYVPLLRLLHAARHALGFGGPSLAAYQALSLLGAAFHLRLLYALAERFGLKGRAALVCAALGTASVNLWAWSLQTMPYTLATSAALACMIALLDERPAWLLAALTGLAMGFDTACLVLVPACLLELKSRRLAYLASLAAALVLVYVPFLALGRALPHSSSALLADLPSDIVSLAKSRSLAAQWRDWLASTAPSDAPWALLAAVAAAGAWFLPRGRIAALWFAGVSAFFFLADPHNRFVYSAAMLLPLVVCGLAQRRAAALPVCAAAWLLLLGKNALRPPDYLPAKNLGFDEADFVASKLKPDDLIVALSEPDLLFQYKLAGRVGLTWSEDPALLRERAVAALRADRAVWLAGDSLFRDGRVPPAEMEGRLRSFAGSLASQATLEDEVSPGDQHYDPLRKKVRD